MTLILLHTFIIMAIRNYESSESSNNNGNSNVLGYQITCSCMSVSSSVCMQYNCGITAQQASCFAGASLITLADGTFKSLADVQIGDQVEDFISTPSNISFSAIPVQFLNYSSNLSSNCLSNNVVYQLQSDKPSHHD
ncbi:unnamed protein product [Rotaria socialis]|uniref:Uncharacterized protein n=1 Tax=Rotaria socialis TaxID=392032 RepID=A0A818B8S1_9BILA|nr:unnamed protein product [Rotaria socialis]